MVGTPSNAQLRAARSMSNETQNDLAKRARVTTSILKLLEDPNRKRPDIHKLQQVRMALQAKGIDFLDATEEIGEGVRFRQPTGQSMISMIRHARALLDLSLDDLADHSGVGRHTIARIERNELTRLPEDSIRKIRETLIALGVAFVPEGSGSGAGVRLRLGSGQP
ncbi:helix-turn-helix domain-containing protein [Rhizobium leguminosarum]|uniref:helix-turn-helix domain-containing protein n=1 Tax=Rhizobium leguminosarum TaxID=384 RepID=UPI0010317790|nr:XRE family transcriptional regulator [Rhizobium leguminosarum]